MYEPRVVVRADESTYNQENGIDIRHHRQVSYFCTFAVRSNLPLSMSPQSNFLIIGYKLFSLAR